jgi:hypothetical protein
MDYRDIDKGTEKVIKTEVWGNMILSSHLHVCVFIPSIMKYKIRLYAAIE